MCSCALPKFGLIRHPRWPPRQPSWKILLSLLLRNYWTDFNQISHTCFWWCLDVPNRNSDRSDIQDGRHGKQDFQDGCRGGHLGCRISPNFGKAQLHITRNMYVKFGYNPSSNFWTVAITRFSRWLPWRPSWMSDRSEFRLGTSRHHQKHVCEIWLKSVQ